jgi:ketosteroid isomerase-like protein
VSQENVDKVMAVIPPPEVDLAELVRSDDLWAQLTTVIGSFFHSDFECRSHPFGDDRVYRGGVDAFRAFWLDWLAPWETYRMEEIERAIDCGDRVVVVVRDFGRQKGAEHEVKGRNAGIWTLREGHAIRWEGYPNPDAALKAVGLEE